MCLANAMNAILKEKAASVKATKNYFYMIIKMYFIVLNVIYVFIEDAKEFSDICVDTNNKFFFEIS